MDISIMLYLLFIISPISIFIHELGHAIAALLSKANQVNISLGTGKKIVSFQIFRLRITWNWFLFLGGSTSSMREKAFLKNELIYISLFGPLFNGLVCLISLLFLSLNTNIALLFLLFNLWLAVGNLLPIRWKGRATDGYTVLYLIRNEMD